MLSVLSPFCNVVTICTCFNCLSGTYKDSFYDVKIK